MISSDKDIGELMAELSVLREKNRVLTAENELLTERAEEIQLLGLLGEKIGAYDDEETVLRLGLEQIALLKDIALCSHWQLDGNEIVVRAVAVFKEHRDDIDLVILDMIMPQMNGRDCFYALKAIRPDARIIISSGFSREEDLRDLREKGLCGFLQKPFRGAALSQVVRTALSPSGH